MEVQRVIISKDVRVINEWLDNGWNIKSVTSQFVSNTSTGFPLYGEFLIVLFKNQEVE